ARVHVEKLGGFEQALDRSGNLFRPELAAEVCFARGLLFWRDRHRHLAGHHVALTALMAVLRAKLSTGNTQSQRGASGFWRHFRWGDRTEHHKRTLLPYY